MTIAEIAKLAGVSKSTVSKVLSGKYQSISDTTRDRILRIVKEYNYNPDYSSKPTGALKSNMLGLLICSRSYNQALFCGIMAQAKTLGYTALVCFAHTEEEESRGITYLISRGVDGVLWVDPISPDHSEALHVEGIPYYFVQSKADPAKGSLRLDYKEIGVAATDFLLDHKHQKLACIIDTYSETARDFIEGCRICMSEAGITEARTYCLKKHSLSKSLSALLLRVTACICLDAASVQAVYRTALEMNLSIPRNLSVIGADIGDETYYQPKLCAVEIPWEAFGSASCKRLIDRIRQKDILESFWHPYSVKSGDSVDVPLDFRNKKIVVVGPLNTDTIVTLNDFPQLGKAISANGVSVLPGGKGVNQAIGAAKLGADAFLIGKIGKDYQGVSLMNTLKSNGVNVHGVMTDKRFGTGYAYVYITEEGRSSYILYEGANGNLGPQDIIAQEEVFHNAAYCLLQTALPPDTVEFAAETAKRNNVNTILKPATAMKISDHLLQHTDLFIPSRYDLGRLCPVSSSPEAQAQYYLEKGVGQVIITMDEEGCFWTNGKDAEYFPAGDFLLVDSTGASDAFIATLAVYLANGNDMRTAIRYANCAAGFSITRQGVPPALIDQSTLELYMSEHHIRPRTIPINSN